MTGHALAITGLVKSFGDDTVLHGVDLTVATGSLTAVVGASGCGKTTLLRLVAGFENPDAGSIAIGGREVSGDRVSVPAHRRDVGYVAQDGALFPHLTVGQNVAYGLAGSMRGRARQDRVAELLETVSLDPSYAGRRPHELSGGQQQRVALARALARRPAVMLLDEPFSALDTGLRASTRKAVADLLSDAGVTTLLVTHDQEEALSIADQVAVMRAGRFTKIGTPRQVYGEPEDRFTAEFLGDCVLLPCTVTGAVAECALGALPVHGCPADGAGTLMLRPEQLVATAVEDTHAADTPDAGDPKGLATVLASEFRGHDVLLTVDLGGEAGAVTVRQHSVAPPEVDAKVRIRVSGRAVVFSDGARIR